MRAPYLRRHRPTEYLRMLIEQIRDFFRQHRRNASMYCFLEPIPPSGVKARHCGACYRACIRATPVAPSANASRLSQAMTMWGEQARQIDPTGKSLLIFGNHVKSQELKYFAFS